MNCPQNYPYEKCPGYNSADCKCPLNLGVNCHQIPGSMLKYQLAAFVNYLTELNEFLVKYPVSDSDIVNIQEAINSLFNAINSLLGKQQR